MPKKFSSLLRVVTVFAVVALACGPDYEPVPPVPVPRPVQDGGSDGGLDGGELDGGEWFACDPEQDAGVCALNEQCRFIEVFENAYCVRACDPEHPCEQAGTECCGGSEDGGIGGYCLPTAECERLDAGVVDAGTTVDAGTDPEETDAGTDPEEVDAGTKPDAGSDVDAGTTVDAGTPDAGTQPDAGTTVDAGTPDAGTQPDAGTTVDAGTPDAGTQPDAGTTVDAGTPDAGTQPDAGTTVDAGTPDAGTKPDAGTTVDAGTPDAGTTVDAGTPDAGTKPDAGTTVDAGTPDAGTPVDAGTPDAGSDSDGGYTKIRIMAANLTSGNGQDYDPGHGIRLMQGVDPDVVLIQEFNYLGDTPVDIRKLVDQVGPGFSYYRETGAQIPNGIISRYPIIDSGEWKDAQVSNRDFAWARIDIPGPRDLWAVSVHLLTSGSGVRNTEATNLVKYINANVPAGDYLVIGGDFNTDSRGEACISTFKSVVVSAAPYPADKNGKDGTNAKRDKPYDHVLADPDLNKYQVPTVIGSSTFPAGLVLDSRVYTPLSEIAPVQSGDSGASQMQHMGVVKDFRVPNF